MSSRKEFLSTLFPLLEARQVGYCVLRNYDCLYEDIASDIDLLVDRNDLFRFKENLRLAAEQTGHRLVHRTRYVNYSYVFWDSQRDFVRVDFETEVRWRVFPILSAPELLSCRRSHQGFAIPHPRHESIILFLQGVWRGFLSERYKNQLASLYEACGDPQALLEAYRAAFGAAADELVEYHSQISNRDFSPALCSQLKRSIVSNTFRHLTRIQALAGHVFSDVGRFWERTRYPAGVSLLFASAARKDANFEKLIERIEFLFPANKCVIRTFDLTHSSAAGAKWTLGLRLSRLRALLKGGLFVRVYHLACDMDLPEIIRTHARYLFPSRTFICIEDSGRRSYLAHVGTGFMAASHEEASTRRGDLGETIIQFISNVLEKKRAPSPGPAGKGKGVFCVLVGLDGSGKTTLARNIAQRAALEAGFAGVRYFHWRPRILNRIEFPLPQFRERARRKGVSRNWFTAILSSLRLAKNAVLANLSYCLLVRPLLRRNFIVLIDRYFYNYYLDPASVKYAGPAWLLARLRPWFPKPDLILALKADPVTLLGRKQEVSREEMASQISILNQIELDAPHVVEVDANQPAARVAETTLSAIRKAAAKAQMAVCLPEAWHLLCAMWL